MKISNYVGPIILAGMLCYSIYLIYHSLKTQAYEHINIVKRESRWHVAFVIISFINTIISFPINFLYFMYILLTFHPFVILIFGISLMPGLSLLINGIREIRLRPYSPIQHRNLFFANAVYCVIILATFRILTKSW